MGELDLHRAGWESGYFIKMTPEYLARLAKKVAADNKRRREGAKANAAAPAPAPRPPLREVPRPERQPGDDEEEDVSRVEDDPFRDGGGGGGNVRKFPRPTIQANERQHDQVLDDAWRALLRANEPPVVFRSLGKIVTRLDRLSAEIPKGEEMKVPEFGTRLGQVATWKKLKRTKNEDVRVDDFPPDRIARDMLATPRKELPELDGVTTVPIFDSAGALISTPGHHPSAKVWFEETALKVPLPNPKPTGEQVSDALHLLVVELLGDFPFVEKADLANALSLFIVQFVRRLIDGPVPLYLIDASQQGSGKGLLADLVAIVLFGRKQIVTTLSPDDSEWEKRILAILISGQSMALLDNVETRIKSPAFAALLTSTTFQGRKLGKSEMKEIPNRVIWVATGNNVETNRDHARRLCAIRIVPKSEPTSLPPSAFRHPNLEEWASEHRGELVGAILTLVQNWIARGRQPFSGAPLSSFGSWSRVLGGILESADVKGFLDNRDRAKETDEETNEWVRLCEHWWSKVKGDEVSAAKVIEFADEIKVLRRTLKDKSPDARLSSMGWALKRRNQAFFGDFQIWREPTVRSHGFKLLNRKSKEEEV